jgi:hypothetical protein
MLENSEQINTLEPIISIDNFIHDNNSIHYTRSIFKNMKGVIKEYAILNYLNFDNFIYAIDNQIKKDYNLESYTNYEIIPLSKYAEYGLELKEYLINRRVNIQNTTSKEILEYNKYYYIISLIEKEELLRKKQETFIYMINEECPICYTNKTLYIYYNCIHTICNDCNINWRCHYGTTCPICRSC